MRIFIFFFLLTSNFVSAQSIEGWIGSPYYFGLKNHFNYQVGGIFKIISGSNQFGIGLEYATKNVDASFSSRDQFFNLPQINLICEYERLFKSNEKNHFGLSTGAAVSFGTNQYFINQVDGVDVKYNLKGRSGAVARLGFTYYRNISAQFSLFSRAYVQYKILQDMEESFYKMDENPRDHISAGLNVGVRYILNK
jgi:hypothetical protein